ncbi:uncharacterized protein LOC135812190 [Sycon ciliatum]|uniref:uncharacterized protein LOC135812190 n=1 Tax=Sycon ciliatum TaxID=27933 RepID=UPI0020ABE144|eukprot:scpid60682/ scgid29403/ Vesicle-associated membrane protein 711; v-SNARE synaptobrevin 7C
MSLIYALVCRGTTVLCDFTDMTGNFETITISMLGRLSKNTEKRVTFHAGEYNYHVINSDGLSYIVMANKNLQDKYAFAYLRDIRTRFAQGPLVERAITAKSYELRRDFTHVLGSQMEFHREEMNRPNRLEELSSQVEEVKGIMTQNIERVLERGEKLDILVEKAADLEADASTFKKTSHDLRKRYWWKNMKWKILIAIVVLLIIIAIILAALGASGKL